MGATEVSPHHFSSPYRASTTGKKKDRREWVRARLEADGKGGWRGT